MSDTPTIRLGLCLAGAVSAGAYTAGVIDYLLEALERWERAKELFPDDPMIPRHRVEIEVITGASAGGICGGFLILQGHKKFNVFKADGRTLNPDWYLTESVQYDAWVNLTETQASSSMMEQLLSTRDAYFRMASSFLNSNFIDELTDKFINRTTGYDLKNLPAYLSGNLEFATSLTNIDGIETEIEFNKSSGNRTSDQIQKYKMKSAKDFGHFQLCLPNDSKKIVEPGYSRIPLCINREDGNKQLFGKMLQATGAFPIGFAPRKITRKGKYIKSNPLITGGVELQQLSDDDDYSHWIVDGGAVNNEPFETAAFLMDRKYEERRGGTHAKKDIPEGTLDFVKRNRNATAKGTEFQTVLMIDPFPNTDSLVDVDSKVKRLSIIGSAFKLLGALRHQPLVKPITVYKSVKKGLDYSRFMLAPRRKEIDIDGKLIKQIDGSPAIACGALGGFSGFLNKAYREHDYMLGRFNCQHYIQKLFGFSEEDTGKSILQSTFDPVNHKYLTTYKIYPFIPDLLIGNNGVTFNQMNGYMEKGDQVNQQAPAYPEFPVCNALEMENNYNGWEGLLRSRLKKISVQILSKQGVPSFLSRLLFRVFWKLKIAHSLKTFVLSELEDHKLIK
ncbi:MAG: patatin-like phospholipase family protein [Chitinophagaceae bacterium]|nr:patatin-like phospholipase family protein [Chitinophagaceae bacterium]